MQTGRNFIGNAATGLAGTLATEKVRRTNDRSLLGIICVGDRGARLAGEALASQSTEGSVARGRQIRYLPQRVTRPNGVEIMGRTLTPRRAHTQDFLDSVRTSREPACPFHLGFRVPVACPLAAESCLQARMVHWDSLREEIV